MIGEVPGAFQQQVCTASWLGELLHPMAMWLAFAWTIIKE